GSAVPALRTVRRPCAASRPAGSPETLPAPRVHRRPRNASRPPRQDPSSLQASCAGPAMPTSPPPRGLRSGPTPDGGQQAVADDVAAQRIDVVLLRVRVPVD